MNSEKVGLYIQFKVNAVIARNRRRRSNLSVSHASSVYAPTWYTRRLLRCARNDSARGWWIPPEI